MTILISIIAPSLRNPARAPTPTEGLWAFQGRRAFNRLDGMCAVLCMCLFFLFIRDPCVAPLNAVYVLPLAARLCGCALCKHLVTAAEERLTTEQ